MEHKPNSILVIQTSDIGRMEARHRFEEFGLIKGKDYQFFRRPDFAFFSEISVNANAPQLVFTSHIEMMLDSIDLAREIKRANSLAVVFALTSSVLPEVLPANSLDGVIPKSPTHIDMPSNISKAFLAGKTRKELVRIAQGR